MLQFLYIFDITIQASSSGVDFKLYKPRSPNKYWDPLGVQNSIQKYGERKVRKSSFQELQWNKF